MNDNIQHEIATYYTTLLKLAYTYVKNREMAEDIVQDVCEKAIRQADHFRGDASYKTYLIRMTINRSYDFLRSWKYKQLSLSMNIREKLHIETPEQKAIKNDEKTLLGRQILKLKPLYREVIVLYYYEDLSVSEISAILDVPENTIKTRLKRGREQIKIKLHVEGVNSFDA